MLVRQLSSRWVVTPWTKRVTTADAAHASPTSDEDTVFLHGLDEVVTARRVKSALPSDDRTQRELVATDEADQQPSGKAADGRE